MTDLNENLRKQSLATIRYRVPRMITNLAENSSQLAGLRPATRMGTPLKNRSVIVVGAGPSLDKIGPMLFERQSLEDIVICTNTALPALHAHGVKPDFCITLEAVDLHNHIDPTHCGTLIADITSHPNTFKMVREHDGLWYHSCSAYTYNVTRETHTRPLLYEYGIITAAIQLALDWGARNVGLVGVDLSYPGGRCYAQHTLWGEMTVEDTGKTFKYSVDEEREFWLHSLGIPAPTREREHIVCEGWGGEPIPTVLEFAGQRDWVAQTVEPRRAHVNFYNCNGQGMRIPGWQEIDLNDLPGPPIGQMVDPTHLPRRCTSTEEQEALRAALVKEAKAAHEFAERIGDSRKDIDWTMRAKGIPMVESLAGSAALAFLETNPNLKQRLNAVQYGWKSAGWVLKKHMGLSRL